MKNKIIFYSSVKTKSLFKTQKFYQVDINILERLGYEITLSNSIFDAFKFWKYDIVFGYFFRYSFFFSLIAKFFGKKVYLTGGIDALDKQYAGKKAYLIQKLFFKLCYAFADKCIIVSKQDLVHVEEIMGGNTNKLVYSEHTIETSAFINSILVNKNPNFCTIAWMGDNGNVKRKGVDKALYLFSLLKEKPEFSLSKFYIIGKKGEGTIFLRSLINELKLEESVIITGEISETQKIDLLKKSKYYIQLSLYEGFGVAALEALIAGNVIIHSGKGGLNNPIYKDHVLIDIDSDIKRQIDSVYDKLSHVNMEDIQANSKKCLSYYDNVRRLKDFDIIIGKCS